MIMERTTYAEASSPLIQVNAYEKHVKPLLKSSLQIQYLDYNFENQVV